ncbi:MAG: acyltransferase, partial [Micromonosporaceae bacterium]|nr:acyltransferase [Micromonosporaceae bacterium]
MLSDLRQRLAPPQRHPEQTDRASVPDGTLPPGPPARPGHRLDIQGLRAIAVLMVVAFHAGTGVSGGFLGVDVFFVISGFVITAMLGREWATTGRIRFGRFYLRRFKRLTPALALVAAVTVVLSTLLLSPFGPQQTTAKTAFGAVVLSANFVIAKTTGGYFDAPAELNPLLNTWSLSVEEQFYLAFPAILALCWLATARARARRWARAIPFAMVSLIAAASFGLAVLGSTGYELPVAPWLLGFYSPVTRAWEFAAGALLALCIARFAITSRGLALAAGGLGAAMLAWSLWFISGSTPNLRLWTLLPVLGTMLLILAGTQGSNPVTRALSTAPMVKMGDWSYSIYLWHWPLIAFGGLLWPDNPDAILLAAALSLVPSLLSYRWVEQPIRNLATVTRPQMLRLVATTLAIPMVLASGLWVCAHNAFWQPTVRDQQASVFPIHAGRDAGCSKVVPLNEHEAEECTWNETAPGRPVYLVGDSNADHFSEGIIQAGKELGRPVIVSTANSCPFIDSFLHKKSADQQWNDRCGRYRTGTLEHLTSAPDGLVIISSTDTYWSDPDYILGSTEQTATDKTRQKMQAFDTALTSTIRTLQRSGQKILLVQRSPSWPGWDPITCP